MSVDQASKTPTHQVYTVINREGQEKGKWIEIGAAWTNRDDSLSINLDALPVNGRIVVRRREPKED